MLKNLKSFPKLKSLNLENDLRSTSNLTSQSEPT